MAYLIQTYYVLVLIFKIDEKFSRFLIQFNDDT